MTRLEAIARSSANQPRRASPATAIAVRTELARRGPMAIAAAAVWFGLVAGVLEVTVLFVSREGLRRVVLDWLRLNHHALWMVLVADLGLLVLAGLPFATAARFLGRRVYPAALAV